MAELVACVDVGSTYTKAALVDLRAGRLAGTASHPTTIRTDVLEGVDAALAALGVRDATGPGEHRGLPAVPVLACSSAGGGLRLAVVGYERVVTAEAGFRVGLSAGARVVHVASGRLDGPALTGLIADRPDVVLLVGGTDGGNADVLLHNARRLATSRLRAQVPIVVAGNAEARDAVVAILRERRRGVLATANVLPRIGVLDPRPAREAIREVFIRHVIGGKGLSRGPRFGSLVRAATPDAVLGGVELLADGAGEVPGAGDVVVVDVGGATTDVYSVITPEGEDTVIRREVVETLWRARTVEGDLGMRWSAPGVVDAAAAERLLDPGERAPLRAAAARRAADPGFLPDGAEQAAYDARLAELAVTVALRRHARPAGEGATGRDLRRTAVVVGSGGVLRHAAEEVRRRALRPAVADHAGGWKLPTRPRLAVDARYVLAAAGLLGADHPAVAARLVGAELADL